MSGSFKLIREVDKAFHQSDMILLHSLDAKGVSACLSKTGECFF